MMHNDLFDQENLEQTYLVALQHTEHTHKFVKKEFEKNIQICASLRTNN